MNPQRPRSSYNKNASTRSVLFFLVWPLGSLLYALKNYWKRESAIIFVLFTGLYGFSAVAESEGLDLYRFLNSLQAYSLISFGHFIDILRGVYSTAEESSADIYSDTVSYLVSRFTTNGKWLMMVFGLVYGYVYSKALSVFISNMRLKGIYSFALIICFSCIFGLDQLGGVRYATAAYIYFFGIIKYLETSDKKYLVVLLLAPLIHFSYLALSLLFGLFLLLRKYPYPIYIILFLSFILPNFNQGQIFQFSDFFGTAVKERSELYTGQQGLDFNDDELTVWYVRLREEMMMIFSYIVLIFLNRRANNAPMNGLGRKVYFFSLLLLSLTNFTFDVPHLGYRIQFVFLMFVIFYVFLVYNQWYKIKSVRVIVFLATPMFILQILFTLRNILATSSPMLYIGNEVLLFMDEANQSFWTLLFK